MIASDVLRALRVDDRTGDLYTEHEVFISPLLLSTEHWARLRRLERLIVAEIDRDGVAP